MLRTRPANLRRGHAIKKLREQAMDAAARRR
jgi:hypothetical protein